MSFTEDYSSILVFGWMVHDPRISSDEVFLYALIYKFSEGDWQFFVEDLDYLSKWVAKPKNVVSAMLSNMVSKGLIFRKVIEGENYYSVEVDLNNKKRGGSHDKK